MMSQDIKQEIAKLIDSYRKAYRRNDEKARKKVVLRIKFLLKEKERKQYADNHVDKEDSFEDNEIFEDYTRRRKRNNHRRRIRLV